MIPATDTAQLLIFLLGVENNFCLTEELLDLKRLKGTTTGKDIFEAVSDAIDRMGLKWDQLCGITTDGAPSMASQKKRMASTVCAKVQQNGGEAVKWLKPPHCFRLRYRNFKYGQNTHF